MQKRYTIFNLYIRGGNQSPQACHALNNLWKNSHNMSPEATELFNKWANESEVEIMLQGGYHADLEDLYGVLSNIKSVPSAKFNESMEALNGACTVVTFVANEHIVAANNFIRQHRLTPANAVEKLRYSGFVVKDNKKILGYQEKDNDHLVIDYLTEEEIFVASKIAFLSLA